MSCYTLTNLFKQKYKFSYNQAGKTKIICLGIGGGGSQCEKNNILWNKLNRDRG